MPPKRRNLGIALAVVVLLLCGATVVAVQAGGVNFVTTWWNNRDRAYPDLDTATMSPTQRKIVDVTRAEFDAQPDGTRFSEGVEENWCADFVSWVMREAGVPFENPHSGHWRIPGVYTLTEYYQAQGRFKAADSGYTPKPGDVMLYKKGSAFGQHTNIVLTYSDGRVTTVGGNEWGGHVTVNEFEIRGYVGLVGYGVLP
ncbi:CHAP domain-containing protein [Gordonia phthalatica]|uniref:Cysteine, histidine-dependent amidohydrolase/peptidase n=1 Tax=Gordonia phthalatica TaxID=1136941 RepID=A0A0N9NLS1_9ACTN|nr:CHAP domain-containing protein [Gordonia phthalatica]ALG87067.1 cysteine, histidine-dependent amidohydrolase/peptidase [Gordonia phthalatica]